MSKSPLLAPVLLVVGILRNSWRVVNDLTSFPKGIQILERHGSFRIVALSFTHSTRIDLNAEVLFWARSFPTIRCIVAMR
jgi:hypothetical protein